MSKILSRQEKLKALKLNIKNDIPDNYLEDLYNLHINNKKDNNELEIIIVKGKKNKDDNNNEDMKKNDKPKIVEKKDKINDLNKNDNNDAKYKVLLNLINKILVTMGREQIDDLKNFKSIKRSDIIELQDANNLLGMNKELFKYFNEDESLWHMRYDKKDYIVSFLKYACQDIGFKLASIQKTISLKSKITKVTYYAISNN